MAVPCETRRKGGIDDESEEHNKKSENAARRMRRTKTTKRPSRSLYVAEGRRWRRIWSSVVCPEAQNLFQDRVSLCFTPSTHPRSNMKLTNALRTSLTEALGQITTDGPSMLRRKLPQGFFQSFAPRLGKNELLLSI